MISPRPAPEPPPRRDGGQRPFSSLRCPGTGAARAGGATRRHGGAGTEGQRDSGTATPTPRPAPARGAAGQGGIVGRVHHSSSPADIMNALGHTFQPGGEAPRLHGRPRRALRSAPRSPREAPRQPARPQSPAPRPSPVRGRGGRAGLGRAGRAG